jgi:alanine racemase
MVIDLAAIRSNFRLLASMSEGRTAAVVKGDAYGHGMVQGALALREAGASIFFVARLDDAFLLRDRLGTDVEVAVLDGPSPASMAETTAAGIIPVINGPEQMEAALRVASARNQKLPIYIHIDTAMNRLGFGIRELEGFAERMRPLAVQAYMTHLAAADDLDLDLCRAQVRRLKVSIKRLPPAPLSIANSCGLFLDRTFHGALTRPGKATFGINPVPGAPNPMVESAKVLSPVVQVRKLRKGEPVGYACTWRAPHAARIAILAIGYSNGYRRSASNKGHVAFGGTLAPVVGRVSMDLVAVDVTALPDASVVVGTHAEIVGPNIPYAELAKFEGTNEHEALIALGHGCKRVHIHA